jgi:O-antigen/teichoic acid export membrane protein
MIWLGHHKACPWLQYGFSHASFVELRRLTVPAFESLAFPLGNALNIQGMRLVVGLTLGPAALAVFTSLRTLSRLAMQPGCIISRLIEPELALAFGNENTSLFQRLFARSCQLGFWGCLGICFLLAPGAYWIFTAWTGGKIAMHWTAYNILLSGLLINSIWYTALMVPYSTNRLGRIAIFYLLIYGITAFGLGYIWTARLGLSGAALALLLAEAAVAVVVIQTSLRMTRMNVVQWIKTVLRPPIDLLSNTGLEFWRRITTVAK